MVKKILITEGKPAIYGFGENPSAPDSSAPSRRIHNDESVQFSARVKEVIGGDSISSFSRRCGVVEGTLRNILAGAWPRTDNLVAIANAGGVTVDWLATGRLPKFRADLRNAVPTPDPLNPAMLRMALMLAEESARVQPLSPEQRADMVLAFYHRLTKGD